MKQPIPQPHIADLEPYRPGMSISSLASIYNLDPAHIIKLASNENPRGMSPLIAQSMPIFLEDAHRYPDTQDLLQALAQKHGVATVNIILGNGSNDVLDLIARVFLGPHTQAVSSQYAFSIYQLLTQMTGAKNKVVTASSDYGHDLDAMAAAVTDTTRLIWIANPNNPTGTFISAKSMKRFIAGIPRHVVVVLDEAYYEYLEIEEQSDSTAWISEFPHLIVTRTFSKAYGLAGFRAGYGVASRETTALLNRVRQPFTMNTLSIRAACLALQDTDFVRESREANREGTRQLTKAFDRLGLRYTPSFGNFVMVEFDDAKKTHESLLRRGIIVRPLAEYALPKHLRISVGLPNENEKLIQALADLKNNKRSVH